MYLFFALVFSSISLLSMSPMSMALFLVLSVLFSCLYVVMVLGSSSWLGYVLALLFIGGVLVVLLILTSLSGVSLVLGVTSLTVVSLLGSCFFLSFCSSYFDTCQAFENWESMWLFVSPTAWTLGFLGCLGCLLFLLFLGLVSGTAGSLRKLSSHSLSKTAVCKTEVWAFEPNVHCLENYCRRKSSVLLTDQYGVC